MICNPKRLARGFTLLEMVLVMFILALLVGAVFGIVRGVTQLASDLTEAQKVDARTHGFIELCARTFRGLAPGAVVRLRTKQTGGRYLSQLVLAGTLSPLNGASDGVTVLETEEAPDGYLRVNLRSLTVEQALNWDKGDTSAGVRVLLMEGVATLEWRFFNPQSNEWEPLWNDKLALATALTPPEPQFNVAPPQADPQGNPGSAPPDGGLVPPGGAAAPPSITNAGPRPTLVELRFSLGAELEQKWVFWTPPGERAGG
ncbi:MAG: type II secretion system protein [Roseimicrobium sp.]